MVNEELYNKRLDICRNCPLGLETMHGLICNPKLYINKEDKTSVSKVPKMGYVKGCSCNITNGKAKQEYGKCIVDKW